MIEKNGKISFVGLCNDDALKKNWDSRTGPFTIRT